MKSGIQTRPYVQGARAEAAEATHRRILDAFVDLLRREWLDDITLAAVAEAAGVTVQTVIRRFGGKEGLIDGLVSVIGPEIRARRRAGAGSVATAIAALVDDYELTGDFVMRMLAHELRHPAFKAVVEVGRASHRAETEFVFADVLARLKGAARERHLRSLIALTDVYVWQIFRRDMGMEPKAVTALMLEQVNKLNAALA